MANGPAGIWAFIAVGSRHRVEPLRGHRWPDKPRAGALLAWTWPDGDDGMTLVVVNLSDGPADGVVHVDRAPAAGRRWRLTDLLDGTTYERDGGDLARNSLYVARMGCARPVRSARVTKPHATSTGPTGEADDGVHR